MTPSTSQLITNMNADLDRISRQPMFQFMAAIKAIMRPHTFPSDHIEPYSDGFVIWDRRNNFVCSAGFTSKSNLVLVAANRVSGRVIPITDETIVAQCEEFARQHVNRRKNKREHVQ
jgi:hypothetical protein